MEMGQLAGTFWLRRDKDEASAGFVSPAKAGSGRK